VSRPRMPASRVVGIAGVQQRVLDAAERPDGLVVARDAWAKEPDVAAGEMRLSRDGDAVTRLLVTFG
jgi:hypothetical protein